MDNNGLKYRYPGVNPFTINDADIFCGRSGEVDKLYTQIMLSKTVVLHAESGTGKSSLVNAGLLPILEKRNPEYIPVYVRFEGAKKKEGKNLELCDEGDHILVHEILRVLKSHKESQASSLPLVKERRNDLWYEAKLYQAKEKFLLFIFDQFEDIQSYSYKQIQKFKEELSLLFISTIPERHYQNIKKNSLVLAYDSDQSKEEDFRKIYNEGIKILREPLNVRALFVIREDKLGALSLLSDCFPDILKNDYFLLPLNYENAWKAIDEPAKKEGTNFLSPAFEFEKDAIKSLLRNLSNGAADGIDPIEIQIICRHIENNIYEKSLKKALTPNELAVTKQKLPSIRDVITTFYFSCWFEVKKKFGLSNKDYDKRRKAIIEELVLNEKKIQVFEGYFSSGDIEILETLTATGLLRKIPIGKDNYYQLAHDRLIKPLAEDLTKLQSQEEVEKKAEQARIEAERKAEKVRIAAEEEKIKLQNELLQAEERNKVNLELARVRKKTLMFFRVFSCLVLSVLVLAIYFWYQAKKAKEYAEEQQYLVSSRSIKNSNPTLSYAIAKDWFKRVKNSARSEDYLKRYDSSEYGYLIGSFAHNSSIISARFSDKDNEAVVVDQNNIYVWNKEGILKENKSFIPNRTVLKNIEIKNRNYFAVLHDEAIEIIDSNEEVVKKFQFKDDHNNNILNIAVSNDAKWILIGYKIYNYNTGKLLGLFPEYRTTKDQIISAFLNDNKHIAVGYASGNIAIFRINENKIKDKINLVKWFLGPTKNSMVTSIVTSKNDKYLFAGNRIGTVEKWEIGKLDSNISLSSVVSEAKINKPVNSLIGHGASVNCMAVSPDGKLILTGSDDFSTILWDFETCRRLAILKARESKVTYVNFSNSGKIMITGTENNRVLLWKKQKASQFKERELFSFCPFDYYSLGLNQYNIAMVYDTSSLQKLFTSTLHYLSNLPDKNFYPEEFDYLNKLQRSVDEVETMYRSLVNNKNFSDSISSPNKWILFNYHRLFIIKEPELLLKTGNESKQEKYKRIGDIYESEVNARLLVDTANIEKLRAIATGYSDLSNYFFDSLKNYNEAVKYFQKGTNLLEAFYLKTPNDSMLRKEVSNAYWDLSWKQLFNHEYDNSILNAQKSLKLYPKNDGVNTNLALGYLLSKKYDKADSIYKKFKGKPYSTDTLRLFTDSFLKDIKDLVKQGIISSTQPEIYKKAEEIQDFLTDNDRTETMPFN